ncbi:lactoylglutathione lyase [Parasphingorhabdus sp.]|jgi:lactoylglutathione lyase|uniref:lactoylglutathione lyase n=1 Tax=Parasphingorhabdus sp. TaxID=2709688 RepID=UPI003001FE91
MPNQTAKRILHSMIRISDLDASLDFYCNILGMREFRRETYETGGFTLSFVGYGDEAENSVIELTFNHDERSYEHGDSFGHIALEIEDIDAECQRLQEHGVELIRAAGPMAHADQNGKRDVIAFVKDPDGHRIELIAA